MKAKHLFKLISYSLVYTIFCLFISCEEVEMETESKSVKEKFNSDKQISNQLRPEGGIISALNENVYIEYPSGAVNNPVNINVRIFDYGGNNNMLLDMISIEPAITFKVPVTIHLRYDGELRDHENSPENCDVIICYWKREYDYLNRKDYTNRINVECICCTVDCETKTVSFLTQKTGIFGLRINNFNIR